ncbi:fumarylacetoacetate hydrolase family protein [Pseudonocardia kujensis]|uniref:fumarylacetoacetate hydrolase family protein n=1 Tax=Pseudonocardia kujensis TaxID=1128675 RepID=UPI001E3DA81E|nr:fumarylacetoacetate hydrolase family protein [Pseudonocardia kujensis]MCE0763314.1 fumarylacetoacetate hydrolase family protein [Pseudonocardia kujensis]
MRLANVAGRATLLLSETEGVDVAEASDGAFGPDPAAVYRDWEAFRKWADTAPRRRTVPVSRADLDSPSPEPRQILAIGLNYAEHAAESGFAAPETLPPTFTKFASALSGPDTTVALPDGGTTDWEVELVVVMGRTTHRVAEADAWSAVAGLTVGQDLSERITQSAGPAPQFGLGKSFTGFAPVGPWLVTPDEFPDPDDLALGCRIDGTIVQDGRTRDLIFPVPALIARLSRVLTLYPGDLVFTGTPSGVGIGRTPQRFLAPGERLVSWVEGIGELHQTFVAEQPEV